MGKYVESALVDGEKVVLWGYPSLWGYIKPLGLGIAFLAAGLVALASEMTTLATYLLVVPPNCILYVWMIVSSIEIAVTDKRILAKTGIVKRDTSELYLTRIEGVEVDQGIIGRMLGFGSVRIRGTGDQVANIPNISDPLEFRNAVFRAGDKLQAMQPAGAEKLLGY